MSEHIEPALSAEEWEQVADYNAEPDMTWRRAIHREDRTGSIAAQIAQLNFLYPANDPRKITRDWIRELREVAEDYKFRGIDPNPFETLNRMADVLASYLPPEP